MAPTRGALGATKPGRRAGEVIGPGRSRPNGGSSAIRPGRLGTKRPRLVAGFAGFAGTAPAVRGRRGAMAPRMGARETSEE